MRTIPRLPAEPWQAWPPIDPQRIDQRDLWWSIDIAIGGLNHLGANAAKALEEAAALAPEPEMFRGRESSGPLEGAGYMVCATDDGIGLVARGFEPYEPTVDLVPIGIRLTDILAADGIEASLTVATKLPAVWFGLHNSDIRDTDQALGAITVHGSPRDAINSEHMLNAFVVDLPSAGLALRLEKLSNSHDASYHTNLSVRAGKVLCVLIARSVVVGVEPIETASSLERFRPAVDAALR